MQIHHLLGYTEECADFRCFLQLLIPICCFQLSWNQSLFALNIPFGVDDSER